MKLSVRIVLSALLVLMAWAVLPGTWATGAEAGESKAFGGRIRLLVPAYGNPCCEGGPQMWSRLLTLARVYPEELAVIFNPASGPGRPGEPVDGNYLNDAGVGPIRSLLETEALVLAYVATDMGNKSPAAVRAEIQRYYQPAYWRGQNLKPDGIFLDQVSADLARVGYYQAIRDEIRRLDAGAVIIGNPGQPATINPSGQSTYKQQDYARLFNVLLVSEGTGAAFLNSYVPPSWLGTPGAADMASIQHSVPDWDSARSVMATAAARGHGWIYVTDDISRNPAENPYDYLPTYWNSEIIYRRELFTRLPAGISGNWYNQGQSGHGFQLERVDENRFSVFWFAFDRAGNQAWIHGIGNIDGNRLVVDAVRPQGGRFPPDAPPDVSRPAWGRLILTFDDCRTGRVSWTTTDMAFTASGSLNLVRASQVYGTPCQ
jgi:Spherulation-specific family 4